MPLPAPVTQATLPLRFSTCSSVHARRDFAYPILSGNRSGSIAALRVPQPSGTEHLSEILLQATREVLPGEPQLAEPGLGQLVRAHAVELAFVDAGDKLPR